MNEKPTHLDLFSGIGGFSLAFESAGFRTVGFSEVDPYASRVLASHFPGIPNFGDVRKVSIESVGRVTVITGGFPCQPFSYAGERLGDSDERFLWPECVRILREVRPRFALFENVPGILTIDRGGTFNRILSDLVQVGYDCLWNCVPACAIGAPHRRDRVWIVARDASDPEGQHDFREKGQIREGLRRIQGAIRGSYLWSSEPCFLRVVNGVSADVDKQCKAIGNAIVPQVAYIFAKAIYQTLTK